MINLPAFISFLFCLNASFLFAQIPLEIHIKDCRTTHTIGYFKFKVYRKKILLDSFETRANSPKTLLLLKKGAYRIEYESFWGRKENVFLTIKDKKKQVLNLCLEYIDHNTLSFPSIIHQLKDGEQYQIDFVNVSSWGIVYPRQSLIIRKRSPQYFASFGEKEIELSPHQIELIQRFETELNQAKTGGCTNTSTYTLTYKNTVAKTIDISCWWDGGNFLIQDLGFEK